MEWTMQAIGVIHSPFTEPAHTPIQPSRSQATGQVEIYPAYRDGLADLDGFSHVFLIYGLHRSAAHYALRVIPFLDDQARGLFATRHPCRPNPIGLSVVQLVAVHDGRLDIVGVDMLDGTPLFDIKPYVPEFDVRTEVRTGWYGAVRARSKPVP
jgi:tRNA (adenine37-N6)-methyltransferase